MIYLAWKVLGITRSFLLTTKVCLSKKYLSILALSSVMIHKYMGSIIVLSISKIVKPNEERKEMTSGFQQGMFCKH